MLPAAVAGLGLLAFLVLGATGLPLLSRYLLLPASLLALWCAVAALGFTVGRAGAFGCLARGRRVRRARRRAARSARRAATRDGRRGRACRGRAGAHGDPDEPPCAGAPPAAGALSVPDDRPYPLARLLVDAPVDDPRRRRDRQLRDRRGARRLPDRTRAAAGAPRWEPPAGGQREWIASAARRALR